jgi:hypothetical protein
MTTDTRIPNLTELPDELRKVAKAGRDAAYVGLGLAVLGAKQAQDRLHELRTQAEQQVADQRATADEVASRFTGAVRNGARDLEARLAPLNDKADELLAQWERTLPEAARVQVARAREVARAANAEIRVRLRLAEDAVDQEG